MSFAPSDRERATTRLVIVRHAEVRRFERAYPLLVATEADLWADREGPNSLPRYVTEQPTTECFVPYLSDPGEAERMWSRLTAGYSASRRVYSLTYLHSDQRIEVRVGEERRVYNRKKDRRGNYVPAVDFDRRPKREGTAVIAIVDSGQVIEIWSVAMTGRWPNPTAVSPAALERIQYFSQHDR